MTDHVESLGPLATTDHSLLRWNLLTSVREVESGANRCLNLDYRRGDFVSFQSQLSNVNWNELFDRRSLAHFLFHTPRM